LKKNVLTVVKKLIESHTDNVSRRSILDLRSNDHKGSTVDCWPFDCSSAS